MTSSWRKKYNLLIFDEIDSTNSEAARLARTYPSSNYVILAKHQTKGRGRNARTWYSASGNLHISILLSHDIATFLLPQLSFVTSIAVYETITYLAQESQKPLNVQLKWPNDVLIDGKKVSGILLESINLLNRFFPKSTSTLLSKDNSQLQTLKYNKHYLIIGLSINIIFSPIIIKQLTTNLFEYGIEQKEPEQLLDIFMLYFEQYFTKWQHEGFGIIRHYWLNRAYRLNELITINDDNIIISGIFEDIDETGAIRVQTDSGQIYTISAGELFILE